MNHPPIFDAANIPTGPIKADFAIIYASPPCNHPRLVRPFLDWWARRRDWLADGHSHAYVVKVVDFE